MNNLFSPKNILNLLISYHWNDSKRIDEVLIEVFYINFKEYDLEEACEKYCDCNTQYFKKLISCIENVNEQNLFKKIEIFDELDGYYVKKVSNDVLVTLKYKEVCSIFEEIEKRKNKGTLYEQFCKLFVSDLGIETEVTKASNDKGIDILGNYTANFSKNITKLIFSDDIYLFKLNFIINRLILPS